MSPVIWVLFLFHFWAVNPSRCFLCLYTSFYFISFDCCLIFLFLCFSFAVCRIHPLSLPLSSCLGCIPPLIGLPLFLRNPLRSVLCGCLLFVYGCLLFVSYNVCAAEVCFLCFLLMRRCPLLATFVFVLFCLLSLLFSEGIPGLIWFGSVYLVITAGFVADQSIL